MTNPWLADKPQPSPAPAADGGPRCWPLLALTSAKLALVRANKGQSRPHTNPIQHYNKTRSTAIFGRLARIIQSPSGKASKLTTRVRLLLRREQMALPRAGHGIRVFWVLEIH